MAYTTLANLKAYLGIPADETQDDVLLEGFIAAAQEAIDAECGRWFEARVDTRSFGREVADGQILYLDADLLSVTGVTIGDGAQIAPADVILWPRNTLPAWALRRRGGAFWPFLDADAVVTVTGTWGYSVTAPAGVARATERLASFFYRQKDAALGVAQLGRSNGAQFGTVVVAPELLADLQGLLRGLRKRTT